MKAAAVERIEVPMAELEALLARAKAALDEKDYALLRKLVDAHLYLTSQIEDERTTIRWLRELLGVQTSEKTRKVLARAGVTGGSAEAETPGTSASREARESKAKGHGRRGAEGYPAAEKITVAHESLKPGDGCPECQKGKVYKQKKPALIVRVVGQAPLAATVYGLQRLRCNLCGEVFTAKPPAGVGEAKYDATAAAMIALLKYGSGLPFNRLAGLQGSLGVPLPASTQWDIVEESAAELEPVYQELVREAAQGEVLYNDDTGMKVLELMKEVRQEEDAGKVSPERTGVFTSGIVSTRQGQRIALFFTGRRHAGENLKEVLSRRAAELAAPIQMCDALSRNLPKELEVILANCLAHGRRRFVDVVENFPEECRHVLEILKEVYKNDAIARERHLGPEERLQFHQAESAPWMEKLHGWMTEQFETKQVEPNSGLGTAITYMLRHWEALTLFLRQAGAPIDNNICERALKKVILHRKNALFFKTTNGAHVGDLFMSLIHTGQLSDVDPFDYLTQLLRHATALAHNPRDWMPWNYRETAATTPGH
jgi:transposase